MNTVLMHSCCAPCSVGCIRQLRQEGTEPVAYWYNPNIHPWKEYAARRDCLLDYAGRIGMQVLVQEDYGLRAFTAHTAADPDARCPYCYRLRLEGAARFAAEHGFSAFTSTLLSSLYQDHGAIRAAGEDAARRHGVAFLYRDFRPGFRQGNQEARAAGLYMQAYCGCIYSEEERYQKKIQRDRARFSLPPAASAAPCASMGPGGA